MHEWLGGFPPPPDGREQIGAFLRDGREQIGAFLRHAFPLGLASFEGLPSEVEEAESGLPVLQTYARTLGEDSREH